MDNEKTSVAFSTTKTTFAEADGDIVMTATLANVEGFEVGGKTGTAKKSSLGSYSNNKINTSK